MISTRDAVITTDDLDPTFHSEAVATDRVAWDIETSGLDWSVDKIGTCQVATADRVAIVRLLSPSPPRRLVDLLEQQGVQKIFHHAPFDLRFMSAAWGATPRNVGCTKIASKILNPDFDGPDHSLQPVLQRHLGVSIIKDQQTSDWLAEELDEQQIRYAADDVVHLLPLAARLLEQCEQAGVADLVHESWRYLPARVALDLRGIGDVYVY